MVWDRVSKRELTSREPQRALTANRQSNAASMKSAMVGGQTPPPPKRRTPMPRRIGRCRRLQDRFSLLRVPSLRATSSLPRRPWAFIGLVGSLGTSLFSSRVLRPRRPRFPTTPPAFGGIRRYCRCGTPCPFLFAPMGAPPHPACALLVSNWSLSGCRRLPDRQRHPCERQPLPRASDDRGWQLVADSSGRSPPAVPLIDSHHLGLASHDAGLPLAPIPVAQQAFVEFAGGKPW